MKRSLAAQPLFSAFTFHLQLSIVDVYPEPYRVSAMRIPRKLLRTLSAVPFAFAPCAPLVLFAAGVLPESRLVASVPLSTRSGSAPLGAAVPDKEHVWNYDGGVFFVTDGATEAGSCFRLSGRIIAPDFFNGLKRIDRVGAETVFRRGNEVVTEFPNALRLQFVIFDFPCNFDEQPSPDRKFLTREDVSSLRLGLYWKHGVDLRPAERVTALDFSVDPLYPPELAHEHNLRERLEWTYTFLVPSQGVPLTDSLVLVVRNREGRIAARVAARL